MLQFTSILIFNKMLKYFLLRKNFDPLNNKFPELNSGSLLYFDGKAYNL